MQLDNNSGTIKGVIIFGGILLCLFLYDKYKKRNLDANARYIYGRFYDLSSAKNGVIYNYYYTYGGKSFKGNFKDLGNSFRKEDLILIKFQSTDPQIHEALYNYKFINNADTSDFPINGWDTLPVSLIWRK